MAMSKYGSVEFSNRVELPKNEKKGNVQPSIGKHNLYVPSTSDFQPFLYKTVEELSKVKSIQFWKNDKVRVLGRIFFENDNFASETKLMSPLKTRSTSSLDTREKCLIKLNMDLMEHRHSRGKLVEVFGYFDVDLDGPELKVVLISSARGINIEAHYEVIKLRNKYVPEYNV